MVRPADEQDPLFAGEAVPDTDPAMFRRWARILGPLMAYHRFRAEGLHHFPAEGPALFVAFHSFATYDGFLFGVKLWQETGRMARGLGDDRIFQTPWVREQALGAGLVPASPTAAEELLGRGQIVGVAPGGMWEALRPSTQKGQVRWGDRRGFVRLALRTQVPVIVGGCPEADDIYRVRPSRLTDAAYQRLHLPLPIARGIGLSGIPRPIPLTYRIAAPIIPPPLDPDASPAVKEAQVEALFARIKGRMEALLQGRLTVSGEEMAPQEPRC